MCSKYVVFECWSEDELSRLLRANLNAGFTPTSISNSLSTVTEATNWPKTNVKSKAVGEESTPVLNKEPSSDYSDITDPHHHSPKPNVNNLQEEVLPREVVVNELQPLRLEDLTGMSCNDDSGHSETELATTSGCQNDNLASLPSGVVQFPIRRAYERKRKIESKQRNGQGIYTEVQCKLCGALILAKGKDWHSKSAHAIIHTDIKRYKCPICNEYTNRHRAEVARHLTRIHGAVPADHSIRESMNAEEILRLEECVRLCFETSLDNSVLNEKLRMTLNGSQSNQPIETCQDITDIFADKSLNKSPKLEPM